MIARRTLPLIGDGGGLASFVHVEDAAEATSLALDAGEPGIYNVTDDEPVPQRVWLPEVAELLGAKPPRRVPVWLARIGAGEIPVYYYTSLRGASNAKAKRALGWQPRERKIGFAEAFAYGELGAKRIG
jgi:nucleoside-diphosphate-sugar epimerase